MTRAHFATISAAVLLLATACSHSWIGNELEGLPPEKQVEKASVVALTRWQRSDSTLKCVLSEILKQAPNTTFYYKIGDELRSHGRQIKENTDYGEGEVMFFTGSPAQLQYAAAIHHERIPAFGDMPIDTLREMTRTLK